MRFVFTLFLAGCMQVLVAQSGFLGHFGTLQTTYGLMPYRSGDLTSDGDDVYSTLGLSHQWSVATSVVTSRMSRLQLEYTRHSTFRRPVTNTTWDDDMFATNYLTNVLFDVRVSSYRLGYCIHQKNRGALSPMGFYHNIFFSWYHVEGEPIASTHPSNLSPDSLQVYVPGDYKLDNHYLGYEFGNNMYLTDHLYLNYAAVIQLPMPLVRLYGYEVEYYDDYAMDLEERNTFFFREDMFAMLAGNVAWNFKVGLGFSF